MTCPIYNEKTVETYRPFCSKRCADLDLGRWLNGAYKAPATDPEALEEAAEELSKAPPVRH